MTKYHTLPFLSFVLSLITILVLCPFAKIFGQVKHFEMPLYFEDAVGNKDTIIWGYDSNADKFIDANLGEDMLNSPLDSVFDIRIGKSGSLHDSPDLGKKRIRRSEGDAECQLFGWLCIVMQVKHNPIKVTYDATLLKNGNACMENTLVLYDPSVYLIDSGPWWQAPDDSWDCLASQNEFYIDTRTYDGSLRNFRRNYPVVGKGIVSIPTIQLMNLTYGVCNFYVHTADVGIRELPIFPNPAQQTIYLPPNVLEAHQQVDIHITDVSGKVVLSKSINSSNVDVRMLNSGIYFLTIAAHQKQLYRSKFIKIE